MHAYDFLTRLVALLPEPPGQSTWHGRGDNTNRMAGYLHALATGAGMSCVCRGRHTKDSVPGQHSRTHEVLFDYCWYQGTGYYALPDVVIEHENSPRRRAFLYDMWKLMAAAAPLRVMIGYVDDETTWEQRRAEINAAAGESAWAYLDESEDLVLLGQYRSAPSRKFVVLHRPAGSRDFRHLGAISESYPVPTPQELLRDALDWLQHNLVKLAPLAERDVVWSIQRHIARRIAYQGLPYAVFNDYPMLEGRKDENGRGRSRSADLVITHKERAHIKPVDLAVELKYEPDPSRVPTEISPGKTPAIAEWKLVEEDASRLQEMVSTGAAREAVALVIDAGGYHQARHGSDEWECWGGKAYVLRSTASMTPTPQGF